MSTTGGSAWTRIDRTMNYGFDIALGSIYQVGSWDHDNDTQTPRVMSIFKSIDDGESWVRHALTTLNSEATAIAISPTNTKIILVGGYVWPSKGVSGSALFKSSNSGDTWNEITTLASSEVVNTCCIDPFDTNKYYVGTFDGLFLSEDAGENWSSSTLNSNIKYLKVHPTIANRIFAATSDGVFSSEDGGYSWSELNVGLTSLDINSIDLDPQNNILYAGSNGDGVFKIDLMTGIREKRGEETQPAMYSLMQNYPNPFNPSTTIGYTLAKPSNVVIRIVNTKGQLVKTLTNTYQHAGVYYVRWDGDDEFGQSVANGVYMCQLKAGDYRQIIKLMLIQ